MLLDKYHSLYTKEQSEIQALVQDAIFSRSTSLLRQVFFWR